MRSRPIDCGCLTAGMVLAVALGACEPDVSAPGGTRGTSSGGVIPLSTAGRFDGGGGTRAVRVVGGATGGSTGTSGTGGRGGTTGIPSGNCDASAFACRGPDPTAATANGMATGPYPTEWITSGYRDGPKFADATIYFPTGDAQPPFGCIAVVPGFMAAQSSIQKWGPFLASHGLVTMTIGTNALGDSPSARADALVDAIATCAAENERVGSPLMGKIAKDRTGIAGWSMGGGGTLIAAAAHPELKAAVSFAAWGPTGGANNTVPALMFEGTADGLAANMSDKYYADVPATTPKMLFEVQGAPHEVANDPANSSGLIGLYGLSWFKLFIEGDVRYKPFLTAGRPSIATSKFATNVK